jgi:uncharacterized protein
VVIFKGSGGVRAGWRYAAFMIFATGLAFVLLGYCQGPVAEFLHVDISTSNAKFFALNESFIFIGIWVATTIAALLERRSIFSYGLPLREAFRGKYWEGIAVGIVTAGLVGIAMYATGGFVVSGFALRGSDWLVQPFFWALAMVLVGLSEEPWFRGYPLQALARGTGFWPAAIISSLIFGGLHLTKAHENFIDIFNIVALGMLTCFALLRTGSLWLAVGFHTAFDFMQFFVIGTPNGGARPEGTLLHASFPGAAWINGGPLGTEASYFMLPVMLLMLAYIHYRYPARPAT